MCRFPAGRSYPRTQTACHTHRICQDRIGTARTSSRCTACTVSQAEPQAPRATLSFQATSSGVFWLGHHTDAHAAGTAHDLAAPRLHGKLPVLIRLHLHAGCREHRVWCGVLLQPRVAGAWRLPCAPRQSRTRASMTLSLQPRPRVAWLHLRRLLPAARNG